MFETDSITKSQPPGIRKKPMVFRRGDLVTILEPYPVHGLLTGIYDVADRGVLNLTAIFVTLSELHVFELGAKCETMEGTSPRFVPLPKARADDSERLAFHVTGMRKPLNTACNGATPI